MQYQNQIKLESYYLHICTHFICKSRYLIVCVPQFVLKILSAWAFKSQYIKHYDYDKSDSLCFQ